MRCVLKGKSVCGSGKGRARWWKWASFLLAHSHGDRSVQFSSVEDGLYALGKAHMRSTPPLSNFPSVALETVPGTVHFHVLGGTYRSLRGLLKNEGMKTTREEEGGGTEEERRKSMGF